MKVFKNLFGDDSKIHGDEIAYKDLQDIVRPLGWGVIVESGENENGSYRKFGDGTMICWMRISTTGQLISNAYGSLFRGDRRWTFPQPFTEPPTVVCSEFKWGSGASWGSVAFVNVDFATLRGIDITSRESGTMTNISAMAIGRWK